jgi:FixJ family two-component response regulator
MLVHSVVFGMVPIVIVDDSEEDALLEQRAITGAGFLNPVRVFSSAPEVLAFFMNPGLEGAPVLMFLDLVLPPWDGIELLKLIKDSPLGRSSVAVVLTGLGDVRQIQPAYHAGAITFLFKPFGAPEFQAFLKSFSKLFAVQMEGDGRVLKWAGTQAELISAAAIGAEQRASA